MVIAIGSHNENEGEGIVGDNDVWVKMKSKGASVLGLGVASAPSDRLMTFRVDRRGLLTPVIPAGYLLHLL